MPKTLKKTIFVVLIVLVFLIITPSLAAENQQKNNDIIAAIAGIATIVGTLIGALIFVLNKIENTKNEVVAKAEKDLIEKDLEDKDVINRIKSAHNDLVARYNFRGDKIKDRFTIYGIRIKANHNAALNINERLVNIEKQIEDVYNKLNMKQRQQNQSSAFKNILSSFDSIPDLSDMDTNESSGKLD